MRPTTLPDAVALFGASDPLAPVYALAFEPGSQQRALILRTLEAIAAGGGAGNLLFPGAAGTGKTTTLILLLSVLDDCGVQFAVGAPTHKAAGRASESLDGRWPVTTHHRWWCGSVEESIEEGEEFSDDLQLGVGEKKKAMTERVLVIDEASMISEEDLRNIRTVAPHATIVGVGDHHQLPPVGSPPGFDWSDADAYGLTQVYRQADGSPVLTAATAIREQRVPFTWSKVANWRAGTDILRAAEVPSRWLDAGAVGSYLAQSLQRTEGSAAAVVGTHTSRVLVNDATRHYLGLPSREHGPAVGERLVARASAAGLANATTCTVLTVERQEFGSRFGQGWIMEVLTESGQRREVALLEQQWRLVDSPANRGKIPYSIRRLNEEYAEQDQGAHGEEIRDIVDGRRKSWEDRQPETADATRPRPERWLVSLWRAQAARQVGAWAIYLRHYLAALDSGYAVTCHAAQGSQWEEVFVVADWVDFLAEDPRTGNVNPDHVYRWSYTALTRAAGRAMVVTKSKGGWNAPSKVTGIRLGTASRDWQARKGLR